MDVPCNPAANSQTHCHPDIDELDSAIVTLAARINAASDERLVLVRRVDERGGWLRCGFPTVASGCIGAVT